MLPLHPSLLCLKRVKTLTTQSALGSGILFTYPEIATIAGVQGIVIYALASALPMLIFGWIGSIIRRHCPEGFVLTEWTRQRFGTPAMLFLSFMTLVTLFLYMIAELSAVGQVVTALTGLDGLPVIIVECVITTIYTCMFFLPTARLLRPLTLSRSSRWFQDFLLDRCHPGRHGPWSHRHCYHHHRRQDQD